MTGAQFTKWLAEMKAAERIRFKKDAADQLGKSYEMIRLYERDGTREIQTDLACAALLAGLEAYK